MVKPCPKELRCDVEVGIYFMLEFSLQQLVPLHDSPVGTPTLCDLFNLFNGQVSSYAIRDVEEYRNFCDRPKDQRPLPEEVIGVSFLSCQNHGLSKQVHVL